MRVSITPQFDESIAYSDIPAGRVFLSGKARVPYIKISNGAVGLEAPYGYYPHSSFSGGSYPVRAEGTVVTITT